jgi:hypothetical protein
MRSWATWVLGQFCSGWLAVAVQAPPLAVSVSPQPGWEDVTATSGKAAVVLRHREAGRVVASLNVVVVEAALQGAESIRDAGVVESLERELLENLPEARVIDRAPLRIGKYEAYRLTLEVTIDQKLRTIRQTTIDVRRGAVTVTAVIDAKNAAALIPQVDDMIASMTIDEGT